MVGTMMAETWGSIMTRRTSTAQLLVENKEAATNSCFAEIKRLRAAADRMAGVIAKLESFLPLNCVPRDVSDQFGMEGIVTEFRAALAAYRELVSQ
jgi:hypothetical protein